MLPWLGAATVGIARSDCSCGSRKTVAQVELNYSCVGRGSDGQVESIRRLELLLGLLPVVAVSRGYYSEACCCYCCCCWGAATVETVSIETGVAMAVKAVARSELGSGSRN
jgi:hypothetical protein